MSRPTPEDVTYRRLVDEVYEFYVAERYAEAALRIREVAAAIPDRRADVAHLAACVLALGGAPDVALAELRAAADAGAWWDPRILLDDDDLASVRTLPGFDELVARSRDRHAAAQRETRPPIVTAADGTPRGVVVALHGADHDATIATEQWGDAVRCGFTVISFDSSQRTTPAYRTWWDAKVGARDVAAALDSASGSIGDLPVIATGFSAGARQAMLWVLSGEPSRPVGFIAVAPAITVEHVHPDTIAAAAERGVRGTIVVGDSDDEVGDEARATHEQLLAAGLDVDLEVVPGLGHEFPADFAAVLEPALDRLVRRPNVVELVPLGADDVDLRRQVMQLRPRPDQAKYSGVAAETLPAAEVDPDRTPFAIVHGGGAVGFGVLDREGTLAEITDDPAGAVLLRGFYLDAAAQGLGLGRAAVVALPGLAAKVAPGASRMMLTVNVENPGAVRAYLDGGFLDTGREYLGGMAGAQHVLELPLRRDWPRDA